MTGKAAWMVVVGMIVAAAVAGAGWAAEAAAVGSTEANVAAGPDVIRPGEASAVATIYCIGVKWPVEGDLNGSARCAVEFREAGSDKWLPAMPLYRKAPVKWDVKKSIADNRAVTTEAPLYEWGKGELDYATDRWVTNYLAGSIFNLKPGTTYEIHLELADADGDFSLEKTLTATTRTEPVVPDNGNKVEIPGGDTVALVRALDSAKPGDIILVHKGTYDGPFTIKASGTAEKPIVIRGAGDGPAVLKGKGYVRRGETIVLQVSGSHICLTGLEFQEAVTAINIGPGRFTEKEEWERLKANGEFLKDIVIAGCTTSRTQYAIIGTADQCYIADNYLSGLAADTPGIDWSEGEGVEIHGSGTVVCYNKMYHLADAVSVYDFTDNQDVYNNDAVSNSDDGIELDFSYENNRVWDNRFWFPANNGVSFQPYIGGPVYIIRNEVIGAREGCSKDRYHSSDVFLINNTFVGHKALSERGENWELGVFDLPFKTFSRNNLYVIQDSTEDPAVNVRPEEPVLRTADMDYDGLSGPMMIDSEYGAKKVDPALYPGSHYVLSLGLVFPIEAFRKVSGALEHYTLVDSSRLFATALPPIRDWRVDGPTPVMLLKEGANAIDAGTVIPNLVEDYAGKAPDLGAHEFGKAAPHYGPRAME
jgi:hypothetical protein